MKVKNVFTPFKVAFKRPKFRIWYLLFFIPLLLLLGAFYYYILKDLPSPTRLKSEAIPASTHIYDRNGTLLYTIYADKNQTFIPLSEIPIEVEQATIAIEDRNFYEHGAIDIRGIVRAAYATIFKKRLEGGSTLTQQLVKNTLLTPERTIERKVKEVILAFATEMLYPKDAILEMYLNQVPYGGTAYGIESAAKTYFGKNANDLTLAESATLAGLPEAPTTYSPFGAFPELAKARQREILTAMVEEGYITDDQKDAALAEKLEYKNISQEIKAPHFVLYIKDLLVKKYGQKAVESGGLEVTTSLDLATQEFAQDTVASEVATLTNYRVSNGAALVTNPGTGEILAMVGSRGYFNQEDTDGAVNVTLAKRQPGSSIKPINYATGLLEGYTAATVFIDKKTCFPNPGQKPYCPRNYDGRFHGPVLMRDALAQSLNIPAVQMLKLNGVETMMATASAMGISTFQDPERFGLSLTLGGGEVTMLDMATAFGVFANQGYRMNLNPILKVTQNGEVLEEYTPPKSPMFGKKVLPSGVAFIISDILADNRARTPAFGSNSDLRIGDKPVSVKTGTTNDLRDNWTIGYTPDVLIVSWVGNNDNTPMAGIASGVTGASPIWKTVMSHELEGEAVTAPKQPSSVVERAVCAQTGSLPPSEGNPEACSLRNEYFIKGSEPKTSTVERRAVWIDKDTQNIAEPGQTENVEPREEIIITDHLNNQYCLTCPKPEPSPSPAP